MRKILFVSSVAFIAFSVSVPDSAHAMFLQHVTRYRLTSRQVERTADYLRGLDRKDLLAGKARERTSDAPPSRGGTLLREPFSSLLRPGKTDSAVINRQRNYVSPTTSSTVAPSKISTIPVGIDAEVFYRNGMKYMKGDGVPKDMKYAYMWLNFALAHGHPLAREVLIDVVKRLNPTELGEAQERTNILGVKFLNFDDKREQTLRDQLREKDINALMRAIVQYWQSRAAFPTVIPTDKTGGEICRTTAATCVYRLDLRGLYPDFILRIPVDPLLPADGNGTGYWMFLDENHRLTIYAGFSETRFISVKQKN